MPKHPQSRVAVTVVPVIHRDTTWPMGRSVWTVARSTSLERSAEVGEIEMSIT